MQKDLVDFLLFDFRKRPGMYEKAALDLFFSELETYIFESKNTKLG